jgi:hypothetical protein
MASPAQQLPPGWAAEWYSPRPPPFRGHSQFAGMRQTSDISSSVSPVHHPCTCPDSLLDRDRDRKITVGTARPGPNCAHRCTRTLGLPSPDPRQASPVRCRPDPGLLWRRRPPPRPRLRCRWSPATASAEHPAFHPRPGSRAGFRRSATATISSAASARVPVHQYPRIRTGTCLLSPHGTHQSVGGSVRSDGHGAKTPAALHDQSVDVPTRPARPESSASRDSVATQFVHHHVALRQRRVQLPAVYPECHPDHVFSPQQVKDTARACDHSLPYSERGRPARAFGHRYSDRALQTLQNIH